MSMTFLVFLEWVSAKFMSLSLSRDVYKTVTIGQQRRL